MKDSVSAAHEFCTNNKKMLENDTICGCFHCLEIFEPNEITQWIDLGSTALCPYCNIDAVIGNSSGYLITKEFLKEMKRHWF